MKFINGWTKNKVIKHIEQNFKGKAIDKTTSTCLYKTKNGKKCAVGLFLPENHKSNSFRGGVSSLVYEYPDLEKILPLDFNDLDKMQEIHDRDEQGNVLNDSRTDEEILMDLVSFIESEG